MKCFSLTVKKGLFQLKLVQSHELALTRANREAADNHVCAVHFSLFISHSLIELYKLTLQVLPHDTGELHKGITE